jgi:hypothetical protein
VASVSKDGAARMVRDAAHEASEPALVPLFDLKFLTDFAAGGVGTSNRRH